MTELTDEQCNEFRRFPGSFNDMVRAIYKAGIQYAAEQQAKSEPVAYASLDEPDRVNFLTVHPEKYPEVKWTPIYLHPPT